MLETFVTETLILSQVVFWGNKPHIHVEFCVADERCYDEIGQEAAQVQIVFTGCLYIYTGNVVGIFRNSQRRVKKGKRYKYKDVDKDVSSGFLKLTRQFF